MGLLDKLQSMLRGDRLDVSRRFELLREAISGTMSNFYMARDIESNRVVGLKIGDREKTETFEARFKGLNKPPEGEIAVSMKHPNIVDTFEYGFTTDGLRYLVMEFLDGPGMHMLIKTRESILQGQRVALLKQMGEALSAVHAAGYIHRDICPRNFICSSDATSVKLIDFGLTVPSTKPFLQPGNRTGTPLYMAPEIVRRRATDRRVDLFSFGVTAYQLCTYEMPWLVNETSGKAALAHDTDTATPILEHNPKLNRQLADAHHAVHRTESGQTSRFDRHIPAIDPPRHLGRIERRAWQSS